MATNGETSFRATLGALAESERGKLGSHPDTETWVAYHGGELPQAQAEGLRDHLTVCPECADLLLDLDAFPQLEPRIGEDENAEKRYDEIAAQDWRAIQARVGESRPQDPPSRSTVSHEPRAAPATEGRPGPPRFLSSALAASVLVALALSFWVVSLSRRLADPPPRGDSAVFDLVPVDLALRGGATQEEVIAFAPWMEEVVLLLNVGNVGDVGNVSNVGDAPPYPSYRVTLLAIPNQGGAQAESEAEVWTGDGLHLSPQGTVNVTLPRPWLRPGSYRIELSGGTGEEAQVLATYLARVLHE